jgi:DNA primase
MRFPPGILDEIRARLPVSQVVGRRVRLKRHGREYMGLSPFKNEKTPSFTVNDEKGFYHCFATGEHGDIFTFLTKTEGLSFPEAVERLADEAGVSLPKPTPQAEAREVETVRLRKLTEAASAFFQSSLRSSAGAQARAYLEGRGLGEDDIETFRLGYAPNSRSALKEHLATKGFSQPDMVTAGLLIAGDDIPVSYDRFRHRLIFPIGDLRGGVIAFGGRALDADQQPKYLNSPETPLFHKGSVLFNASAARQAAHERGAVIVAEGYMDVIALTRGGFPNSVAPLGTALTPDQLKLLWRMASEPVLCFDGDSAGMKAAYRAVETALPMLEPGRSLAFAFLPDGLDPDDLLRQQGREALGQALGETRPLVEVLWKKELQAGEWTTPERRAQLETRMRELTGLIADKTVRLYYEQEIRQRLRQAFAPSNTWGERRPPEAPRGPEGARAPFPQRQQGGFPQGHGGGGGQRRPMAGGFTGSKRSPFQNVLQSTYTQSLADSPLVRTQPGGLPRREALLIQTLLNHPWLLDDFLEDVAAMQFEAPALQTLRDRLLCIYYERNPLDNTGLHNQLEKSGHANLLAQVKHAITHNSDWDTQPHTSRDDVLTGWRHRLAMHRKAVELKRELESAEKAFSIEQSEENYLRLQDLSMQALGVDGAEASVEGYRGGGQT